MKNTIKQIITYTWIILLFVLGTFYLFRSFAHAAEEWYPSAEIEISRLHKKLKPGQKSVYDLREEWKVELKMHQENGVRCFENAKDRCWWLPIIPDREKARKCYNSVFAALGGSTPSGRLVLAVSAMLCSYGIDCIEEWHYINNQLNWAKFHFDMCDHYMDLLRDSQ